MINDNEFMTIFTLYVELIKLIDYVYHKYIKRIDNFRNNVKLQ